MPQRGDGKSKEGGEKKKEGGEVEGSTPKFVAADSFREVPLLLRLPCVNGILRKHQKWQHDNII